MFVLYAVFNFMLKLYEFCKFRLLHTDFYKLQITLHKYYHEGR